MTSKVVKTQAALNAALADPKVDEILIDSPRGVWLEVAGQSGSATVSASGSATVSASGSATVSASGSATVSASGSATVSAYGSATVRAYGSATVSAYDSATVSASGSATVRAYGSATVRAYGSATVSASGSATVRAYDSATVRAYDSATVSAGTYVAVHLHSQRVKLDGGVVIDMTAIDRHDINTWCELQGVDITDGTAIVYKAVNADLKSTYGFSYPIGETVVDPLWAPTDACGAGLHFGASPAQADAYYGRDDVRFLACRIPIADAVGITGYPGDTSKCKARTCDVLFEVDINGKPVA